MAKEYRRPFPQNHLVGEELMRPVGDFFLDGISVLDTGVLFSALLLMVR